MQPRQSVSLKIHRKNIDSIDRKLLALIEKRLALCKKIGVIKKKLGLPIYQPAREKLILQHIIKLGKKRSLDPRFIKKLFNLLFDTSKKAQLSRGD